MLLFNSLALQARKAAQGGFSIVLYSILQRSAASPLADSIVKYNRFYWLHATFSLTMGELLVSHSVSSGATTPLQSVNF